MAEVALLPVDPDESASAIMAAIAREAGADVAVIISDTFGRPWREGCTDVAIGVAGMDPLVDYRGVSDPAGHELRATVIAAADELAAAADLVMGASSTACPPRSYAATSTSPATLGRPP